MVKTKLNPMNAWPQFVCGKCKSPNIYEANFCGYCGNNLGFPLTQKKEAEQIQNHSAIWVLEKFMVPEPAPFLKPTFEPWLNNVSNTFSCCYLYKARKFIKGNIELQNNKIRFKSRRRFFSVIIPILLIDQIKYKSWYGSGLIIIPAQSSSFSFSFYPEDAKSFFKILTASKSF